MIEHSVFFLMDGARPDAIDRGIKSGWLPNFEKVFARGGQSGMATTVFPSTTGPAYVPFLTGCFPGTCNLPGIRWFDREKYSRGGWSLSAVRSYVGIESYFMNRDLAPHIKTLFELLLPSSNIFSSVNRGVPSNGNRTTVSRALLFLYAHYTGDWSRVDRRATAHLLKAIEERPRFLFVVYPGVDEHSHLSDPFSKQADNAYRDLDHALGLLVDRLEKLGMADRTLIVASSDHGLSQTKSHLELWKEVEARGFPTLYHPKIFRRGVKAACMVSGNSMAHLYLANGKGWDAPFFDDDANRAGLVDALLNRPEIDQIITRREDNQIVVRSHRGTATLRENQGKIEYMADGSDPFGFKAFPRTMTFQEALDATFESDYPDALVQVAQLFRSRRSGDVVVTARPGYDLRSLHEKPEHFSSHGSLHKDHMLVPFLANRKMTHTGFARTADIFPTILTMMGETLPTYPIDGRSLC